MERDFFRDTWVRYLGYANEVGEAFRPVVSRELVRASYAIAFGYVLADTADKSLKMIKRDGRPAPVLIATGDALLWQTFATVVIPGYTINKICYFTRRFLLNLKLNPRTASGITVAMGLASIPIIILPIDEAVTAIMDATYRKIFRNTGRW